MLNRCVTSLAVFTGVTASSGRELLGKALHRRTESLVERSAPSTRPGNQVISKVNLTDLKAKRAELQNSAASSAVESKNAHTETEKKIRARAERIKDLKKLKAATSDDYSKTVTDYIKKNALTLGDRDDPYQARMDKYTETRMNQLEWIYQSSADAGDDLRNKFLNEFLMHQLVEDNLEKIQDLKAEIATSEAMLDEMDLGNFVNGWHKNAAVARKDDSEDTLRRIDEVMRGLSADPRVAQREQVLIDEVASLKAEVAALEQQLQC